MIFNHCSKKVLLAPGKVLQIVFRTVFSRLPRNLGHLADSNSIPKDLTSTFRPVLTVAMLLTYLPSLVGRLFQRCHLSRIDEVLKCCDSMIESHILSQIRSNCPCRQLSVLATVPRIFKCFSVSCADFVLHG